MPEAVIRLDLLLPIVLYFLIVSIGIGVVLARRWARRALDFTHAAMTLPWWLIATGVVLGPFGAGHTLSPAEASWVWGLIPTWWAIVGGTVSLSIAMFITGRWYRSMGVATLAEAFERVFGSTFRALVSTITLLASLAICSLEFFASGAVLSAATGLDIATCMIFVYIFFVVYVVLAGMMQLALLNTIYLVTYYICVALALYGWTLTVNKIGGWAAAVQNIYSVMGAKGVSLFVPGPILELAIPIAILHAWYTSLVQGFMQPILSARDVREIIKGWPLVIICNSSATAPWVITGLLALALPSWLYGPAASVIEQFRAMGPAGAVPAIITSIREVLWPVGAAGLLMTMFVATLSTGAMFLFGAATAAVEDIIVGLYEVKLTDRAKLWLTRGLILAFGVLTGVVAAFFKPFLMAAFLWVFSWTTPLTVSLILGWTWRRNGKAALWTCIITWIFQVLYTIFGDTITVSWLVPPMGLAYVGTLVALILYIVLTIAFKEETKEPAKQLIKT
jgi:Na+/proline symporter